MPRTFLLCCADIFNSSCCLQGCLVPRSSILPIYTLIQLSSVWLCVWLAVIVAGGQSAHVTVPRVALIWANTAQELSDTQWSPSKVVCWLSCLAMNTCDCCRVTNQWKQLGHGLFIFSLLLGLHPQQHSPRFCHREERTDLHLKHPSYRTLGAVVAAHDFKQTCLILRAKLQLPKAPQRCAHPGSTCTRLAPGPRRRAGRAPRFALRRREHSELSRLCTGCTCRGRFSLRWCSGPAGGSEWPGSTAPTSGCNRNAALPYPPARRAPRLPWAAALPAQSRSRPRPPRAAPGSVPLRAALACWGKGSGGRPRLVPAPLGVRGRTRRSSRAAAGGGWGRSGTARSRRGDPVRPTRGCPALLGSSPPRGCGPPDQMVVPSRTHSGMAAVRAGRPHAVCDPKAVGSAPLRAVPGSGCGSSRCGGARWFSHCGSR